MNPRNKLINEVKQAVHDIRLKDKSKYEHYLDGMCTWIEYCPLVKWESGKFLLCEDDNFVICDVFGGRDFVRWFFKSYKL